MWSTEGGGGVEIGIDEEGMREREDKFNVGDLGEGGSIGFSKGPKGFRDVWIGGITFDEG